MIKLDNINKQATIQKVKEQLMFLSQNIWMLQDENAMVEEACDLMDFLPYTRSIIHLNEQPTYSGASGVINAMEKRNKLIARQLRVRQEAIAKMQLYLYAITYLPEREKMAIEARYVHHRTLDQLSYQLHVSISTTSRLLDKAYLHLAQLLDLEVLQG